jgi:hypothetical protein
MLHALVAFLPVALTFPENPNSIDSPLAWNPLSTGIGKLPPNSLRAWWDASKLNANDIYWGYPSLPLSGCGDEFIYTASGTQGGNIITVTNSNNFLNGGNSPGLLLQIETDPGKQTYEVVSVLNSNTFTVKPALTTTFSNQALYVAQLLKWPDASGNREHMGFWSVADTYTPSIYIYEHISTRIYRDGYIYHYGHNLASHSINANQELQLGDNFSAKQGVRINEVMIAKQGLDSNTRIEIEGYLAWKWQIQNNLPKEHPYSHTPPPSGWSPIELGNNLVVWLDAQNSNSLFTGIDCNNLAQTNDTIGCWRDLSPLKKRFTPVDSQISYSPTLKHQTGLAGLKFDISNNLRSNIEPLGLQNDSNFFIAIVTHKEAKTGNIGSLAGPIRFREIGTNQDRMRFPFPYSTCIGISARGNDLATNYFHQRSTLVLQGNVRNQPFYKPYFHSNIKSSLTTRSAPTYLHEQPYLLAMVADFSSPPVVVNDRGPILLGTLIPKGTWDFTIYLNHYLGFGASSTSSVAGKLMLDQGWNGLDYDINLDTQLNVYLLWRKESNKIPLATVNGLPVSGIAGTTGGTNGFLRVSTHQLSMLAMGDYQIGGMHRFSGSIYEAMVLTGPNIKYGHQRLIEGYLAWKWGLQHKLPRRHSYRRVPPAR